MIYWELLIGFLQVGCFAFGGAYGAIPLIRDIVLGYGWLSEESLTYMIAISESTPGPIMVNMATYIGSSQGGIPGAAVATLAVVLPSFFIMLLVSTLLAAVIKNKYVQAVLRGLKPCVVGIVLATGIWMTVKNFTGGFDFRTLIMTVLLAAISPLWKKFRKKKLSPIALIAISAVLGMVIYGFL